MNKYKEYIKKCEAENKQPVGIVQWLANRENIIKRWYPNSETEEDIIMIRK